VQKSIRAIADMAQQRCQSTPQNVVRLDCQI
jgi:hypothetical protein